MGKLEGRMTSHIGATMDKGRPSNDFYETPEIATEKLLGAVKFNKRIWEPACGAGAIVKILKEHGYMVFPTDLYEYETSIDAHFGMDFLTTIVPIKAPDIITNPPFTLSFEFAKKGVEHIERTGGKMALLLRLSWLESQKRKEFLETSPLSQVLVFSKRIPMMHRPAWTGKKVSSMMAFAWFVWSAWNKEGPPTIGWL